MTTQQILQGVHDWTNGKIVYDISVAHPDGQGNPTPYANLTAALGNGGANIPEPLRKGGMSVKFIRSSDNKYVRYNLKTTSFSTTVTDWELDNDTSDCEKITNIVAPVDTTDPTEPITTLSCEAGKYYRVDVPVDTLAITLPLISDNSKVQTVVIYLSGGTTPAVTISGTAPSGGTAPAIYYQDGFEIAAGSTYEINCLWNGSVWIVAGVEIKIV